MSQRPVLIASWNGAPATSHAASLIARSTPMLDAIVAGIALVEDDPEEMTVGYGGLPNEEGEVELDAAVMDGPRHKAGAVAGLRRCRRAAALALEVLRRTDHALLVGDGASRFARQLGYTEENLLTPKARDAWLAWKASLSERDAWIAPDEGKSRFGHALDAGHTESGDGAKHAGVPRTWGTIHVSGLDANGDLYAATSTSGLSYKLPGRAGDSPVVGSGLFIDNDVGSAGATGRGEASLQNCVAYETVRGMETGLSAQDAALAALRLLARRTREPRLLDAAGHPDFNVIVYALRKDGDVGAASIRDGYTCIVQRGGSTATEPTRALFPKN